MYAPYKNIKTETRYSILAWCNLNKKSVNYHSHPLQLEKYNGVWI